MQEPETREFPLADILSVTTPRLLSMRKKRGVCDLVEWMLCIDPIPRMINLQEWSRLKTAAEIARRSLLRQHPQLRGVEPPADLDRADLLVWLFDQERIYGEHLLVERATVEMREICTAVIDFAKTMNGFLQSVWAALQPTFKAMAQFGEELRELAEQPSEDEAANSAQRLEP